MKKLSITLYLMLQRMLPQHLLSRLAGWLATRQSRWLRCTLISVFMAVYDIDLTEAKREKHDDYIDFNDFFARTLKPEARPIHAGESDVVSPVDGRLNTFGHLHDGTLIQAKGHQFVLADIVADEKIASLFAQGYYASIYLAPHNYHRIHMPFAGELKQMIHVPGDLFAVNPTTMANMAVLARNERVICVFDTSYGEMAMIMVGAMIVGSIKTLWAGRVQGRQLQRWTYPPDQVALAAGDDMGEFRLGGSMVIVLFANRGFDWQKHLVAGQAIKMGQHMGGFDRLAAADADQTQQHKPSTASQSS